MRHPADGSPSHRSTPPSEAPPQDSPFLLWTRGLSKSYGTFTLGPLDVGFRPGETVALLGKNGAGKTTFFELLTGHLDATSGAVYFENHRITPETTDIKRRLGYLPQYPRLPLWVTPHDLLVYAATLLSDSLASPGAHDGQPPNDRGSPSPAVTQQESKQQRTPRFSSNDDLINHVVGAEDYWDCASYRHKPLGTLSYGMQKRVGLALATLHDPEVLILDEPHSGLDIFHCRALDDAIRKRSAAGKATIISTHVAAFAASICERVMAIEKGAIEELATWQTAAFLERIQLIETRFFSNP